MTQTTNFAKVPRHVAIIMDGNGRWAQQRGLERTEGHRCGVQSIHVCVEQCLLHGIEVLTLFAFSSENWRRPKGEINFLFELFYTALTDVLPKLLTHQVRLRVIGDLSKLSKKLQTKLKFAEQKTASFKRLSLVIAVNYGGRWDILQAVTQLITKYQNSDKLPQLDEEEFTAHLSLNDLPEPDLFIRTSGEQRISNFLLWQMAYTEMYFTQLMWPEFREQAFEEALHFYASRIRRFGATA